MTWNNEFNNEIGSFHLSYDKSFRSDLIRDSLITGKLTEIKYFMLRHYDVPKARKSFKQYKIKIVFDSLLDFVIIYQTKLS